MASSIASVFERVPRPIAAPALIRGLHTYPKKARFLGALGRIATPDAGQAILAFAKEQLAALTDPGVLLYVVGALGDARLSEAVSILGAIRDDTTLDLDGRIEAHNVLANTRRELFEETGYESADWQQLGIVHTSSAKATTHVYGFLASNAFRAHEPDPEATEDIEVVYCPLDELMGRIIGGEIRDACSIALSTLALAAIQRSRMA